MNSLVDAEELHFAHPDTFQLPTYWERMAVEPDMIVKLIFEPDPDRPGDSPERMWVRVTSNDNGEYAGTLENTPLTLDIEPGAEVVFLAKHIIDIHQCEDNDD